MRPAEEAHDRGTARQTQGAAKDNAIIGVTIGRETVKLKLITEM
jgi:hypothetical protein